MSPATVRPMPFRRENVTEENYLVVMHYVSELLWLRGRGADALDVLTKLLTTSEETAATSSTRQSGGYGGWPAAPLLNAPSRSAESSAKRGSSNRHCPESYGSASPCSPHTQQPSNSPRDHYDPVMPIQVSVCGPRHCTPEDEANAYHIGQLLAEHGATVICGGGTGVMAAVAKGVRERGGLVIGIRPGSDKASASPDLSAVLVTNMGEARNAIIVWSADAVIAIGGSWGTLSEVALAKRRGDVPVIAIGGWRLLDHAGEPIPGIAEATTPEHAVTLALQLAAADSP